MATSSFLTIPKSAPLLNNYKPTYNGPLYTPANASSISPTGQIIVPSTTGGQARTYAPSPTGQPTLQSGGYTPPPQTILFSGGGTTTPTTINSNVFATGNQSIQAPTTISGGAGSVGSTGGAGLTGMTAEQYLKTALGASTNVVRDANGNYVYTATKAAQAAADKGLPQPDTQDPFQQLQDFITKNQPQKESRYNNPEYQAAFQEQAAAKKREAELNGQITSIVNEAQQAVLGLANQGRGIPQDILSTQADEIYRRAAIHALPYQSQLAIAQGDYQTATDHLQYVGNLLQESIDTQFRQQSAIFDSAVGIFGKKIDAQLADKKAQAAQTAQTESAAINDASQLAQSLLKTNPQAAARILTTMANQTIPLAQRQATVAGIVNGLSPTEDVSIKPLDVLDVARYNDLYPDAGVTAGDTQSQANAKVTASNSPEAKLRTQISGFKTSGTPYDKVVSDINTSTTIKDKTTALKIVDEVYGPQQPKQPSLLDKIGSFLFGGK